MRVIRKAIRFPILARYMWFQFFFFIAYLLQQVLQLTTNFCSSRTMLSVGDPSTLIISEITHKKVLCVYTLTLWHAVVVMMCNSPGHRHGFNISFNFNYFLSW